MSFFGPPSGAPAPSYGPPAGGSMYGPPPGSSYPPPGASYAPPGASYPPAGGSMYGPPPGSFGAPPPQPSFVAVPGWAGSFFQQITPQELAELQRWFTSVDTDRSGSISAGELQNLAFGGIPLGYDIALKLIKVFDRDYSGSIEFNEYASLHKFIQSMQFAFARADKNRNGLLDAREILAALHQGGMSMISLGAVQALFRKHARGKMEIAFSEFLGLVSDIALMRTKFEQIDIGRTGVININLDTLITIGADL